MDKIYLYSTKLLFLFFSFLFKGWNTYNPILSFDYFKTNDIFFLYLFRWVWSSYHKLHYRKVIIIRYNLILNFQNNLLSTFCISFHRRKSIQLLKFVWKCITNIFIILCNFWYFYSFQNKLFGIVQFWTLLKLCYV